LDVAAGEEPAEIKKNPVNLGGSQEGGRRVGTRLMRKADSSSYKQNPTSPETHGLASTHIT